ncbi:MAG: CCA tRNA nucleotidyltransferase [Candidatus Aenigmarchaeota archaeon]|nr:CCA tRNA nucleotidyltransferase [Candidatus Aenigmarchaeota archaeon]
MQYKFVENIIKKITPKPQEEKKIKEISNKVLEVTRKISSSYDAEVILAGSLTRDTWLPNKNEIDVFILFPKTLSNKQLEETGLSVGKKVIETLKGKWTIEYAQHPYIRGKIEGISIDLVPCYKLEKGEKIISAVDRTQFHVKYLEEKLPKQLSNEVRLLKQFLKANGLYGADAKTNGFSGYLCELLIIKYSSFLNLLKAVKDWKVKEIIDIENQWKKSEHNQLKNKFKNEILIVIDPVDKHRNVASAISPENFYRFKKISQEFLLKPSEDFFFKKTKTIKSNEFEKFVKSRGTEFIAIVFEPPKTVPDILWPQLRKATKRLESIMKEYEFAVLRSDCWTDEKKTAIIVLEMQVSRLPTIDKIVGPWVFDERNAERFAEKHKNDAVNGPFIEDDYWVVEVNRSWTSAKVKLVDTLSDDEKILKAKGIPNFIATQLSKSFKIIDQNELKKFLKNKEFAEFMKSYFEKGNLFTK